MSTQIFSDPFVVLDTETTGVYNNAQLLEIAAVCIDEWGNVRTRFSSLIKPERPVDPNSKAMQVNQISVEELERAPDWDTVRFHFDKWLL